MRKDRQLRVQVEEAIRPLSIVLVGTLAAISLLWYKLVSLTHGRSPLEISTNYTNSWNHILNYPINGPYHAVILVLSRVNPHSLLLARSISSIFGLITVAIFFIVLMKWQTVRVALLATLMFTSSAWFLHTARFASPDILLFGLLWIVLCGIWLRDSRDPTFPLIITVLVVGSLMYVPGLVWFIIPAIIWQRRMLAVKLKRLNIGFLIFISLLTAILIVPLILGVVRTPSIIRPILGIPSTLPSVTQYIKNLIAIPIELVWRGPNNPNLWLGRLPILSIFGVAMFSLGCYAYYLHSKLDQGRLLAAVIIIGSLLVALGGPVTITILIPFIYLVVAAGLAFMLQQWFTVFPRNPLARYIGLGLLITAIALSCFYQLNHYFIAWPKAPATKQAFSIRK